MLTAHYQHAVLTADEQRTSGAHGSVIRIFNTWWRAYLKLTEFGVGAIAIGGSPDRSSYPTRAATTGAW